MRCLDIRLELNQPLSPKVPLTSILDVRRDKEILYNMHSHKAKNDKPQLIDTIQYAPDSTRSLGFAEW